jgi:hypothetical protein
MPEHDPGPGKRRSALADVGRFLMLLVIAGVVLAALAFGTCLLIFTVR